MVRDEARGRAIVRAGRCRWSGLRARADGLLLGLVAACGSDTQTFVDVGGLASVIIVDEDVEVAAESYVVGPGASIVRPLDAAMTTWVLGYGESLEALELPRGRLTLGDAGGALPAPTRAWRVDVDGPRVDAIPPWLAARRVAERTGCRRFTARSLTFPRVGAELAGALLPLEDAALLTTTGGRFVRLGRAGAEVLSLPEGTPFLGGWSGRGTSWLVGPGFASGALDAGFTSVGPPVPLDPSGPIIVDGPHDDAAPFELFALDLSFAVAHFDGLRWRRIVEPPTSLPGRGGRGIAWVAPGRAAVVGLAPGAVVEVSASGVATSVSIDIQSTVLDDDLWRIAWVAGVGPVVGTRDNVAFVRGADGAWRQLPLSPVSPRADVFVSLGDGGFLAGGTDGVFGQWTRLGTTCTTELLGVGDTAYRAIRLGTDLLFVSEGGAEAIQYTVMTPVPR